MDEQKDASTLGKISWVVARPPLHISIAFGALISVAGFFSVLSAAAWLMPRFLRITDSPSAHFLPAISILILAVSGLLHHRRKYRANVRTSI